MGQSAAIFHTAKQQRGTIREKRCAGIEYAVDRIGPILSRQDWIAGVPLNQSLVLNQHGLHIISGSIPGRDCPDFASAAEQLLRASDLFPSAVEFFHLTH